MVTRGLKPTPYQVRMGRGLWGWWASHVALRAAAHMCAPSLRGAQSPYITIGQPTIVIIPEWKARASPWPCCRR